MTLEQKNFILGFLAISGINKEVVNFEEKIRNDFSKIIDLLPKEERKKGLKFENDLIDFIEILKWNYFNYGVSANETLEEWQLTWTPDFIEIPKDEKMKKIA